RHPAHHPLPAHPGAPDPRRRAHPARRAHRRIGRARARRSPRARGLRRLPRRGGVVMTEVLDVARIKADFPIFQREVNGKPLVYLDSAASAQKPRAVLDAMEYHHRHHYANVHRGIYTIAEESTAAYEGARAKMARLLNAG